MFKVTINLAIAWKLFIDSPLLMTLTASTFDPGQLIGLANYFFLFGLHAVLAFSASSSALLRLVLANHRLQFSTVPFLSALISPLSLLCPWAMPTGWLSGASGGCPSSRAACWPSGASPTPSGAWILASSRSFLASNLLLFLCLNWLLKLLSSAWRLCPEIWSSLACPGSSFSLWYYPKGPGSAPSCTSLSRNIVVFLGMGFMPHSFLVMMICSSG